MAPLPAALTYGSFGGGNSSQADFSPIGGGLNVSAL